MVLISRGLFVIVSCLAVVSVASAQSRKRETKAGGNKAAAVKTFPKDALGAALAKAKAAATRQDLQRLLVVVRDDPRNDAKVDGAEVLSGLRQRMVTQLRGLKLDATESAQIEKLVALTRPAAAIRATDLGVFQNFAKFDAVLDVVVRQRGAAHRLSLTLITDKTKLWSGTVAAPESIKKEGGAAPVGGQPNGGPLANVPLLNRRVLKFALSQVGRKVGNGECWTLAAQALVRSGARPANFFDFGKQIPLGQILPGDILQFKSARFEFGSSYYFFGAPDHTVVVMGVDGSKVQILHQNFGKKIVTTLKIDFKQMTKGKVWAWRPVAR